MNPSLQLAIQLESERAEAMVKADIEELSVLFSKDLYYGHSGGYFDGYDSMLEKIKQGRFAYDAITSGIDQAIAAGPDSLVIHGKVNIKVTLEGKYFDMRSIYLAVWRQEKGEWRFLAHQTALEKRP